MKILSLPRECGWTLNNGNENLCSQTWKIMWGNNIIATVRVTEKGFYEFWNFGGMFFFCTMFVKPYLT